MEMRTNIPPWEQGWRQNLPRGHFEAGNGMLPPHIPRPHFPPGTADGVVRDNENIIIRTQHKLYGTMCTIRKYTRKGCKKEMYMTKGLYEFKKTDELKEGDKLEFQLSDPPKVVVVDIICGNN
ncbi:hypothetical protein TSUD_87800 [Trifolium subterraneum]|uniref:TF-B3 domain-containing protein n=1 Tax=Trifolium subterraneum TaxID=3900 RepID=A0A2Z6NWZ0_TRISU|nr:hypothetical protein TSUD_87800 [Trifolium subterraneum]